jgi:hypothetical protein
MVDIQSERLVYLASAFGALLLAFAVVEAAAMLRARPLGYLALAVFCAVNLRTLRLTNTRFAAAGALSRGIVESIGPLLIPTAPKTGAFILNLPDTHYGIYVFRNGLSEAVSLFQPRAVEQGRFVLPVAREIVLSPTQSATVSRTASGAFHVAMTGWLAAPLTSTTLALVDHVEARAFDVRIRGVADAIALYVDGGRLQSAGVVHGNPAPIGVIDTPAGEIACDGTRVRFAGWVLFSGTAGTVTIDAGSPAGTASATVGNPREDVAALFPGWANSATPGWEYWVPCGSLPAGTTTIRVIASDVNGTTDLGSRTVRGNGKASR